MDQLEPVTKAAGGSEWENEKVKQGRGVVEKGPSERSGSKAMSYLDQSQRDLF